MRHLRTPHQHPDGRAFSWLALIKGLGFSMLLPVFPIFVKTLVGSESMVSIFYSMIAVLMLISALFSSWLFSKMERTAIVKTSFSVVAIAFFFFIFSVNIGSLSFMEGFRVVFYVFILVALGLYVRDFSKSKNLGASEGLFYRFSAMGFLIGPLIGGFVGAYAGYEMVFLLASLVMLVALVYFHHLHIVHRHKIIVNAVRVPPVEILTNIRQFFANREAVKTFLITIAFMSWICFQRIYVPLYIVSSGYMSSLTGIVFALGLLPLILLEVKVGQYADKHGVRIPITTGFVVMGTLLLAVFVSPWPLINFLLLIMVNLGSAMVEPLQEYYLFKHLQKKDENHLYGVYMTADPVAFFFTPLIGAAIITVLPFKFLFLFFGAIFWSVGAFSWTRLKER